jgi:hypothetical protein
MNDELRNAKSIYKAYRSQNINDSLSWIQKIKQDFAVFKSQGFKMMILSEF